MMRQHTPDLSVPSTPAERRTEAALDFILAVVVGFGLTLALVSWWSV